MESWIEEYMKLLAKHEGTRGARAIEGGGYTRGYGLTDLAQSFMQTRGAKADEMSDKELAKEYVLWNAEQIKSKYDNYEQWPDSVKMAAVDLQYNGGDVTRFKNFDTALREGRWQDALGETLDVVGANDPETGKRGALRGLGNRRFDIYNIVADDVGFEKIQSLEVIQDGDSSIFSYTLEGGSTIDKAISVPIHTASGAYDSVKKKTLELDIPLPEEGSFQALFPQPSLEGTQDIEIPSLESGQEWEQFFEEENNSIKATDSFSVPSDFNPSADLLKRSQDLDLFNFKDEQPTIEPDQTPDKIVEDPNFDFNRRRMRYGELQRSRIGDDQYDYDMFTPNTSEVAFAAMRQYNLMPALYRLGKDMFDPNRRPQEGYSAFKDRKLKKIVGEEGLFFFRHSQSHYESMQKLERMESDMRDAEMVQRSRSGTGLSVGAAVLDPSFFLPFTGARGVSRMHRFSKGFIANYAATGAVQAVIEAKNESRDAQIAFLGVMGAAVLGGAMSAGLGKGFTAQQLAEYKIGQENLRVNLLKQPSRYSAKELKELKQIASAGSAISPELARTNAYRMLEQEGLEATGIGIERLGWNPTIRMFKSANPIVRELAPELVDVGGLMQKKVRQGTEMKQSVETTFRTTYYPSVLEAVRVADTAYLRYRNRAVPTGEVGRAFEMMKVRGSDLFKRNDGTLTEVEFRNRVGYAMRRGDVDNYGDAASDYVTQAAQGYRKVFNKVKDEANSVRLFEREMSRELAIARRAGDAGRIRKLEDDIARLREHGVTTNTAISYVPRIYRIDKIEQNVPRFLNIVKRHLMSTNRAMSGTEADRIAAEILDTVTRRKPFIDYESATDALDWLKAPSGAQARSLNIPDEVLEEFLESDIEALMRTHVKTMGMDIELTRKFGDSSLEDVIGQVEREYQRLISETQDFKRRSQLAEGLENDIRDIRGLRDRLRGTYGASKDPHQLSSRFVRVMKSFNVLTSMGSAVVSSVPDIARVAMVEGFLNAYGRGFMSYFDESAKIVRQMSKPELEKAAIGVDAALGLRAHAMSDMGDLFGNRYTIERALNDATGMFFFMNGLNIWNQVLKEMAGNVTMLRMTESIMASGGWTSLTRVQKEKLLKNGIGRQDYDIMRMNITNHGEQVRGEWLPNTDGWTNATQRLKFRNALNQNVERIIVTPGAGDRALWTSTEFGSLLTQFKSYGQGAMVRMLTSGLQEKDAAFWQGAFMIVGLAGIVNEIKRKQYGMDSYESFDQKLINAIDRSGLLGWFTDANNGLEKLSDYQLGMRPLLTDQASYPVHTTAKAGAVLGPAASTSLNSLSVFSDMLTGNVTRDTAQDLRFIFPTGNLFYLDPVMDGVFGEGRTVSNVNRQQ